MNKYRYYHLGHCYLEFKDWWNTQILKRIPILEPINIKKKTRINISMAHSNDYM